MRLLNTTSGRFVHISDPQHARYAIISHTWAADGEQNFSAILAIQRDVFGTPEQGPLSRPTTAPTTTRSILFHRDLSPKIREACRAARSHGYELLWYDACCIDKRDNTELSEALSSMYDWYRWADVCYVYLADVPPSDKISHHGSAFRASRWHKRGWTLQELIAPTNIVFLAMDWSFLGTKTRLAELLESITGIATPVLLHKVPLSSVCVAQRMSWASSRQTLYVEDEAYCLMGIFNVRMRLDYGERHKAFLRLQKKIMKEIPSDQSLFVWGPRFSSSPESVSPVVLRRLIEERMTILDTPLTSCQRPARSLFASSPHDFRTGGAISALSNRDFETLVWGSPSPASHPEPTGEPASPHALRIRFPIVRYPLPALSHRAAHRPYRDCSCGAFECTQIALLQCTDGAGNVIALPLCEPPADADDASLLVGTRTDTCLDCKRYYRTWTLSPPEVRALRPDVAIAPLTVRRDPLEGGPGGALPLRIRRVAVKSWCTAALNADGYMVSLRRLTIGARQEVSEYANDYLLALCPDDSGASRSTVARIDLKEIEVHIAQGERPDGVSFTVRQGRSSDPRSDTVAVAAIEPSPAAAAATTTRISRFVPFSGQGEARGEFELRAPGRATPFVLTLHLTPQSPREPAWTFGGWGQAPYVDFMLHIELTTSTTVVGDDRRSRTA